MTNKTPSEKILQNPYDGKELIDKKGRKILLRNPDILDLYDLMSAIGEDSKNPVCASIATRLLYVATIDGLVFQCPKSLSEFRINLRRLGQEGIECIGDFVEKISTIDSEEKEIEEVKK